MRATIILALVALLPIAACCQTPAEGPAFTDYMEMRTHLGTLYEEERFAEGAQLLEWALERFPDHLQANTFNLAVIYCQLEENDRALGALEYALDRGTWFSTFTLEAEIWEPLRGSERFAKIETRNKAFRQEAQQGARPELLVVTPEGYDKTQTYPLFIALHGGGENMTDFKEVWTSPRMKTEFITAYLQSSLVVGVNQYSWTEDLEISAREIADAYRKITDDYPVAQDQVIVGGFSSGGVATLDVSLTDAIPLAGFIALCPAKPESFNEESVARAKERGLRGTLLTTEMDPRLPDQRQMAAILEKSSLPHQFVVTPNIGHWIPEDLGAQIDSAIGHIFE